MLYEIQPRFLRISGLPNNTANRAKIDPMNLFCLPAIGSAYYSDKKFSKTVLQRKK